MKKNCPYWVKEVLLDEIRYTESMRYMESIDKYLKQVLIHPEEHLSKERSTREFMKIVTRKRISLPPIPRKNKYLPKPPRKSKKWTG